MKRNKKFYENKRYRKLSKELDELRSKEWRNLDKEYGRWNGSEFYVVLKNTAKEYHFYHDLKEAVSIGTKVKQQRLGGGFFDSSFTEETHKIFQGDVYSLIKLYPFKKTFFKEVPERLRYIFEPYTEWVWCARTGNSEESYSDWHISDKYWKYLRIDRRRAWEMAWSPPPSSEYTQLYNKIYRDNLWFKIDRAVGNICQSTWDKIEKKSRDSKKKIRALREMNEEIAEMRSPYPLRSKMYGKNQVSRDWERVFSQMLSDKYYDRSREETALSGCRGIFTLNSGRTWDDIQGY